MKNVMKFVQNLWMKICLISLSFMKMKRRILRMFMIKIEFNTSKFILTRLVIPLMLITIGLSAADLIYFQGSNGIVINLITDFIVILISSIFVSWVLNENQKRIWNETDSKIKFKIQFLINDYNSSIRGWLNYPYPTEILDREK